MRPKCVPSVKTSFDLIRALFTNGMLKSPDDLTPEEGARLQNAFDALRKAARANESPEKIDALEYELWRLRRELLDEIRPAWAPKAAFVADWFSKEDEAYDALDVDMLNT